MNVYEEENDCYKNDPLAVLMDYIFKSRKNMHVIKPLLKIFQEKQILPSYNYDQLKLGLKGFYSDENEEEILYDNMNDNIQFNPTQNDEKNLVKLLADVNKDVYLSKNVLQSVILSWLVINREYTNSKKLIDDSNKLYKIIGDYKYKKYGKTLIKYGGESENQKIKWAISPFIKKNLSYVKNDENKLLWEIIEIYNNLIKPLYSDSDDLDDYFTAFNLILDDKKTKYDEYAKKSKESKSLLQLGGGDFKNIMDLVFYGTLKNEHEKNYEDFIDFIINMINDDNDLKKLFITIHDIQKRPSNSLEPINFKNIVTLYGNIFSSHKNNDILYEGGLNLHPIKNVSNVNTAVSKMLNGGNISFRELLLPEIINNHIENFPKINDSFLKHVNKNGFKIDSDDEKQLKKLSGEITDSLKKLKESRKIIFAKYILHYLGNNDNNINDNGIHEKILRNTKFEELKNKFNNVKGKDLNNNIVTDTLKSEYAKIRDLFYKLVSGWQSGVVKIDEIVNDSLK